MSALVRPMSVEVNEVENLRYGPACLPASLETDTRLPREKPQTAAQTALRGRFALVEKCWG